MLPNTQGDTEEDDITGNTIIHNDSTDNLSIRETATNTAADKHEVNDIATFTEKKLNDLSEIMEKGSTKLRIKLLGCKIWTCR